MSTQSAPAGRSSAMPPGPRYAASVCEDEGNMVMTSSLCRAASATEPAAVALHPGGRLRAAGTTS